MEESDLQAHYRRNYNLRELYMYIHDEERSNEFLKNLIKSAFDQGKTHDALRACICAYDSRVLRSECVEIFIDGVAKIARESIKEIREFGLDSFLCSKCSDVIRDPVTLKCGHTFSKQCILSEIQNGSFDCQKCGNNYSFSYISELKNNVTILSIAEKLSERQLCRYKANLATISENSFHNIYDAGKFSNHKSGFCQAELSSSLIHTSASLRYLKKGNILLKLGYLNEAFLAYLTSFTLDPNALNAKMTIIEVFRRLLQGYSISPLRKFHSTNYTSVEKTNLLKQSLLIRIDGKFLSSGSSNSLHVAEDDRSSSDEEEEDSGRTNLHLMLNWFLFSVKEIGEEMNFLSRIEVSCISKQEFECPLCMRMFWEPVTTTCGHTFCRGCLNRSFDHQSMCPLCKTSLEVFIAEHVQHVTEFLELAMKCFFPVEYDERRAVYMEEMEAFSNAGKDPDQEIPLFVCTVALPTVPCPLHVFEPRYRLMIRQCIESGGRQFGMCGVDNDEIAEYGTMLEIQNVNYFPDGRSVVHTVGRKRFRILRRGKRDGYHTASVEFLEDQPLSDVDLQCIGEKHDRTYSISKVWFKQLPADKSYKISEHFGTMPPVEANYISSPDGPSWLWWVLAILPVETKLKILLISLTSLSLRLEFLYQILLHFHSQCSNSS